MTTSYDSQVPYDWETRKEYIDLPFPISEYDSRIRRVRKAMEEKGVGVLMVFGDAGDPGDLVYLSNYIPFGRAALLLPLSGPPQIVTDAVLHGEPINSYAWMTWVREFRPVLHSAQDFADAISTTILKLGGGKVGVVGRDNLPMSIWQVMSPRVRARCIDFWFEYTSVKSIRSAREIDSASRGRKNNRACDEGSSGRHLRRKDRERDRGRRQLHNLERRRPRRRLPHHSQLRPEVRAQAQLPDDEEDDARGYGLP